MLNGPLMCYLNVLLKGGELFALLEKEGVFLEDSARYYCACVTGYHMTLLAI